MESVDSNLILGDMGENLSISSSAFKEVFAMARQGRHWCYLFNLPKNIFTHNGCLSWHWLNCRCVFDPWKKCNWFHAPRAKSLQLVKNMKKNRQMTKPAEADCCLDNAGWSFAVPSVSANTELLKFLDLAERCLKNAWRWGDWSTPKEERKSKLV